MNLGLYGGSFDPIHLGHLLVAQAACEELSLDRLFFIPASQSPFKPGLRPAAPQERLRLMRLALAGEPRYEIDDQEVRRGGVSYSIDTVRGYASRFPGARLHYLIGADHVGSLPKWRESNDLASLVEFVVIPRPGAGEASLPPPFRLQALHGFPLKVSSSEIRDRVRRGAPIRNLVPSAVEEAIRNNRLYLEG
jgi:nicotinate-nucleotide adenylyltransferase